MISQHVIDTVDRLKPNAYTGEDKLSWISDVETKIRTEIIKTFGSAYIDIVPGVSTYQLPTGVTYHDIEYVFLDGKKIDKLIFASIGDTNISVNANSPKRLQLYYLLKYPRFRYIEYVSDEDTIEFETDKIITTGKVFNEFFTGDRIIISGCTENEENNKETVILSGVDTVIDVEENTFVAGEEPEVITIKRVLDDYLIVPQPYDKIYKEYVMAMIDFNNREYESYNNAMAMYNYTLNALQTWYKQRSPINQFSRIRNIW